MSKQIDLTEPLSVEDREWLLARGRAADVALADAHASIGAEASATEDETPQDIAPDPSDSYDEWNKAQLQSELEDRGLNSRGTVAELIARLREADSEVSDG